jgi:hypothetical protein
MHINATCNVYAFTFDKILRKRWSSRHVVYCGLWRQSLKRLYYNGIKILPNYMSSKTLAPNMHITRLPGKCPEYTGRLLTFLLPFLLIVLLKRPNGSPNPLGQLHNRLISQSNFRLCTIIIPRHRTIPHLPGC